MGSFSEKWSPQVGCGIGHCARSRDTGGELTQAERAEERDGISSERESETGRPLGREAERGHHTVNIEG